MQIKELLEKAFSLQKEGMTDNEIKEKFTDEEWLHVNDYLQRRYDIEMFVEKVLAYLKKDNFFLPTNEEAKEKFISNFTSSMKRSLMKGNVKPVYDELMDRCHGFLQDDGCFNVEDKEMLSIVQSLVRFDISVSSKAPSLDMIEFSFKNSADMESSVLVSVYNATLQTEGQKKGYIEGVFQLATNMEEKVGTFLFHVSGDFKNCDTQNKLVSTYVASSLNNKDKSFMALLLAENIKKYSLEHDYIKIIKDLPKEKEPFTLSVYTEKKQPLLSGHSFETIEKVCAFVNEVTFETLPISPSLRKELLNQYGGVEKTNEISLRFSFMHEESGIENADREAFLLYISNRFGVNVSTLERPMEVAGKEVSGRQGNLPDNSMENKDRKLQKQVTSPKEEKDVNPDR